ncbi:serine hydrolase domain-containing protein [Flavobacteriaceae bacterium 3-367]
MKTVSIIGVLLFSFSGSLFSQESSMPSAKAQAVQEVLKKHIELGIPGLAITVYSAQTGFWSHTEGWANLENKTPLTSEHLFYLQSTSKTYMAVAILKLYEMGKLDLDDMISRYLPPERAKSISGSNKISIRMLLNHTSGLPEYNSDPILVSRILHHPLETLSVWELLQPVLNKELEFEPGSRYRYRNTNYTLLSLIADTLTGDHVAFVQKEIIETLGLTGTRYLTRANYQEPIPLVDAYWDVLLESKPTNVSGIQRANVASMKGDDGLVASTLDAVRFMKGLVEGKLLKPETLALMQQWVHDEEGKKKYGLGLAYYDLDMTYAIGHSGGGIGAGCVLLYLPELQAIVFVATNFNTMMESPIRKKAEQLEMEILLALFSE